MRAMEHYGRTPFSPAPCLTLLGSALVHGPEAVDTALVRCEELVAAARSAPTVHAHIHVALANLEAMRGNLDAARARLAVTDTFVASHGGGSWPDRAVAMAAVELQAGRPDEAVAVLEAALAVSRGHGEDAWTATLDAFLADVCLEQGLVGEALELSTTAARLASQDDVVAQTGWRRARARALARSGDIEEAERLAREAVALLADGDAVTEQAETLICLAEVLHRAGRAVEAEEASAAAYALFTTKGNSSGLERARRRLAGLEPVATA
jgi:tetratricopeptide (TPR) repeat protein